MVDTNVGADAAKQDRLVGSQKHRCQFVWLSPAMPGEGKDGEVDQIQLCWHKSKWFPPRNEDKRCPHENQEQAETCEHYLRKREPTAADLTPLEVVDEKRRLFGDDAGGVSRGD